MTRDCNRQFYRSNTQIGLNVNAVPVGQIVKVPTNDVFTNTFRPFLPLWATEPDGSIVDPVIQKANMPNVLRSLYDDIKIASDDYANGVTGGVAEYVEGNNSDFGTYVNKNFSGLPDNVNRFQQVANLLANFWDYAVAANVTQEVLLQKALQLASVVDKMYYLPQGYVIFDGVTSSFGPDWLALELSAGVGNLYLCGLEIHPIG